MLMERKDRLCYINILRDMLAAGGGDRNFIFDDGVSGPLFKAFGQTALTKSDRDKIWLLLRWVAAEFEGADKDGIRKTHAYHTLGDDNYEKLLAYSLDASGDKRTSPPEQLSCLVRHNVPELATWCPSGYDILDELHDAFYPDQEQGAVEDMPKAIDSSEKINFRLDVTRWWDEEEEEEDAYMADDPWDGRSDMEIHNEESLFNLVKAGLRHAGGDALYNIITGQDSDYAYRLERLSPGCTFTLPRDIADFPQKLFDDWRAVLRFIIAVSRLEWVAKYGTLPIGNIPFIWTDKDNVEAIRRAFDALLDVRMTELAASLYWQEREPIHKMDIAGNIDSVGRWLERCKSPARTALTEERLGHVWGIARHRMSNVVAQVGRDIDDLPALVMLQGLLTAIAVRNKAGRRETNRRLRALRHLVEHTDRRVFAPRLTAMLCEARVLMLTGHISADSQSFCARQKREEVRKQQWLAGLDAGEVTGDERALVLFENHPMLRGAVDFIAPEDMDMDHYCAFCELLNDTDKAYRALLSKVFVQAGMKVDGQFATPQRLSRFLVSDAGDMQEAKRQAVHDLLAEPARQFALVRQAADKSRYMPDETSYYNVYAEGREQYLKDFARL